MTDADRIRWLEGELEIYRSRPDRFPEFFTPVDYVAANLREALKLVPDTGDWHGQLRNWCAEVLGDRDVRPNRSADMQRAEMESRLRSEVRRQTIEECARTASHFTLPGTKRDEEYWPAPYEKWNDSAQTAGHFIAQEIASAIRALADTKEGA